MERVKATTGRKRLTDLLDPEFMNRLDSLDVLSRKLLQGKLQGERRSKRRGQSVEFADHRPYVVGDDLRFVDWNIYGRLEQLFLKLFIEEQDLTVHVMADASASMSLGEPSKELFIKKLAAALGYVSLVNNNRVTLSMFADGVVGQLANMRGRNYLHQMADFLLTSQCDGLSQFESSCRQIAGARIGAGVMIVLSDFLFKEGYDAALRRLIGRQYDLYIIQVLSPQELSPDFGGDLKLIDIEDADAAEVTVSAALVKYYKRNLTAYCNELKDFCTRRGAVYALANSADSVESLVLNYLRRIRLLR
ncbi:MAG: DUF58 domain-containing protein [Sedimentisphaerales bacterium]|nr:DUF58 domain-containing protein [Sedimentisphaerales bacterium]